MGEAGQIRNIIFDLGSVLLDIEVSRTLDAFKKMGIASDVLTTIYKEPDNFFILFERGDISAETFRDSFRKLAGNTITDHQIDEAWNAMVLGFPEHKVDLLKCLRENYTLILLSNTNGIHEPVYNHQFEDVSGGENLHDVFHKVYYSHDIGMSKPDPGIYTYVLKDAGIQAGESLFIDDLIQNVEAASGTGIVSHHFTESEELEMVLQQYGISF